MTRPIIAWLVLSTIWGSTWLFIKLGLQELPPFTFAWARFAVALVPLLLLWLWRGGKLPRNRSEWGLVLATGWLTFSLNYALVYWAELHISSGLAALLYTTHPLFGLVLAHFMLPEEPMSTAKLSGVLLSMVGVAAIFSHQLEWKGWQAMLGSAAVVVAACGSSVAVTLIRKHGRAMDSLTLTLGQMFFGWLPLLGIGLVWEGNPLRFSWSWPALGALLYLGIMGTALTFWLLNWLLKNMAATKTQLIPFFSTVIAVFLGWLILNEVLDLKTLLGGVMILIGLYISSKKKRAGAKTWTPVSVKEETASCLPQ